MSTEDTPPLRRVRSFVLRAGRMTAGQERAWRELWPKFGIEADQNVDLDRTFARVAPRMLEIGFGTGDALLSFAQLHPEIDCVGIEVHRPGVGHLMLGAEKAGLANVRVVSTDAVEFTERLPERSIAVVHIFFPDPWHKKRHHKRRLIQPSFVDSLARLMDCGGVVRLATDWADYAQHIQRVFAASADFRPLESGVEPAMWGISARPDHRPQTRFERRGQRLGHEVFDFAYVRADRASSS